MSAIMLTTGLCFEVAETRANIGGKAGALIDLTVNGVATTFRAASIIAVADSLDGLQPSYVAPKMAIEATPVVAPTTDPATDPATTGPAPTGGGTAPAPTA